jgi:hypothetical protein
MGAMPSYRFYTIRKDGHIAEPPSNHDAPDDLVAVKVAKQITNGSDIEIWQGARLVAHVVPNEK